MSLIVSKSAPDFTADCVTPDNKISTVRLSDYLGKYVILLFYPLNFTFVCPTELVAVNNRLYSFEGKNAVVISVSVDSHYSHLRWKKMPISEGGIGDVQFIMASDLNKKISASYGVLNEETGVAMRAIVLIDKNGNVLHLLVNAAPLGRDGSYFDYICGLIEGYENYERNGEVCPAGWGRLKKGMQPNDDGVSDYLSSHATDV